MQLIDDISEKYQLNFDRKYGHITAAVHEGHLVGLTQGADARKYLGEDHTVLWVNMNSWTILSLTTIQVV